LRERYVRVLRWVLAHRIETAMIVVAAMWTLPYAHNRVRLSSSGIGGSSEPSVWFFFDLPSGGDLERADAFFTEVEKFMYENVGRYDFDRIETRFSYNDGRVQLRLRQEPNKQWFQHAWDSF